MKHIALIGIDGAGKTTLADMLYRSLADRYRDRVIIARSDRSNSSVFREVEARGEFCIGDDVRLLGYALDLAGKYMQVVRKQEIEFVIWDRYSYCLNAYFSALNIDLTSAAAILSLMHIPEHVFLLDIDARLAIRRMERRREDRKPEENPAFLSAVREAYLRIAEGSNIKIIDATLPEEEILESVLKQILSC
jgi:thymidylate kinase